MSEGGESGRPVMRAEEALRGILSRMGLEATVTVREEAEQIVLDVAGPEAALVIGKKGATLDAIQYLVIKMSEADGAPEEGGTFRRLLVDADGYRARRTETLVELAHQLVERARKTRQIIEMEPMSPQDRRIVHVALAGEEGISTRSEGEGAFRRLLIVPEGATGRAAPGAPRRE